MKINIKHPLPARHSQRGSAVLALLVLLGLMLACVAANQVAINTLRQEVLLVEKRQTERLAATATNAPPANPAIAR